MHTHIQLRLKVSKSLLRLVLSSGSGTTTLGMPPAVLIVPANVPASLVRTFRSYILWILEHPESLVHVPEPFHWRARLGRSLPTFLTRLMVTTQVQKQVLQGIPDPIPNDAGEPDLARQTQIPQLPGIEIKQFGGLLFCESQFAVDEVLQLIHFVQDGPNDFLNQGPDFFGS
jgi:hypothetical protein